MATFTENKGQWPEQVLYRARIPGGCLYVEREALTFSFATGRGHHHGNEPLVAAMDAPQGHAYRVRFVGGRAQASEGSVKQAHYENFFLGNDPGAWGSGCDVYGEILLRDVWPGIHMRISGSAGLKYDLIVEPGADPAQIALFYEGQDAVMLTEGRILVSHSLGQVTEAEPRSWTESGDPGSLVAGVPREVSSAYRLSGDTVGFLIGEFDPSQHLIIDPVLSFASYSGSTADNFGFTATYDNAGHLYGGGGAFGAGYPTTPGVFDPAFNGGTVDVAISKWSPDGATLVWSTYLGGSGDEVPHSLVVNQAGELYIMGSTGSIDFPTTAGCHDPFFGGGPGVAFSTGYGFTFPDGVDIFVAHLNAAATALIGSTYVGGDNTDGVNNGPLSYNYGDPFRGEIALDLDENPVVASCTAGGNATTTPGAPQTVHGGGPFDAYIFRLNPTLSTMLWATYHGGSESDVGHGVQFDSAGRVYVTGGTMSSNMPTAGSPLSASNSGGTDGYIVRYSTDGSTLQASTYLGTAQYDQCFFVQIDSNDDVYVVGQTRGNYPQSAGVYGNPGSSQFIHKLNNALSTSLWSTRVGNGTITQDLSPTAFLVSDCGQIYMSAWGGGTNNNGTPDNSTSNGMPLTPDAFQSTTNGSDFHLMVLEPNAAGLSYGTYFGGSNTSDHVDGGTSRFDKNGVVYQAVCAGCGGSNTFPTTPGAWSNTNNSLNCNLGVFKFDLNIPIASIDIDGPSTICFPDTVQFVNNSSGGNTFFWEFGDGGTSTDFAPVHIYTQAGVFPVTLVMTDQFGCTQADTASITVTSVPTQVASIDPIDPLCPGGTVQLMASGGDTWEWFPPDGLSDTSVQDPLASPVDPITYFVVITSPCGTDTASVEVLIADPQGTALPDVEVCLGDGVMIGANGGITYEWTPPQDLSDASIANPIATPSDTTTYHVLITTAQGCQLVDSITVNVVFDLPDPALSDTLVCVNGSVELVGPVAGSHLWQSAPGIGATNTQTTVVTPTEPTTYVVTATNVCGSIMDSAFVDVITAQALAWPDTVICPGNPVPLFASGGATYQWSPPNALSDPNIANPICITEEQITYLVTVTDVHGCTATATVSVGLLPPPTVYAGLDLVIDPGDEVLLTAIGNGDVEWSPPTWLDCPTCPNTWAAPEESTTYTVTLTGDNGCSATDRITIILNGTLFVPNTFTPNDDGVNDLFGALGSEIETFTLLVFDRWGELIFRTDDIDGRWDGTYKGHDSPIDTYVWRVDATELSGHKHHRIGHVNLVR